MSCVDCSFSLLSVVDYGSLSLVVVCGVLFVVYCLLFVVCRLPAVDCYWLLFVA